MEYSLRRKIQDKNQRFHVNGFVSSVGLMLENPSDQTHCHSASNLGRVAESELTHLTLTRTQWRCVTAVYFTMEEKRGTERLSNLSKIIKLVSGGVGIQPQEVWSQSPCFHPLIPLSGHQCEQLNGHQGPPLRLYKLLGFGEIWSEARRQIYLTSFQYSRLGVWASVKLKNKKIQQHLFP